MKVQCRIFDAEDSEDFDEWVYDVQKSEEAVVSFAIDQQIETSCYVQTRCVDSNQLINHFLRVIEYPITYRVENHD